MADIIDVLLAKYDQEKSQARKHELLRSTSTNYIIAISAGMLAFASKSDPMVQTVIGLFLVILGVFGALLSQKHYERFHYHTRFAKAYDEKLAEWNGFSNIDDYAKRREDQKKRFPFLHDQPLNWLWTAIHLFVSVIGILLLLFAVVQSCRGGLLE
ncbi:hypothetical protein [Nitratireductor sp. XY-223]|uniref:hypothetical protein n=1 Tax=Nitratireductor sp. XY-223 TaxID=2561926 RepID=UPI0010AA0A7B|nr:hypothetical protein [Nitratireductor sp. XY-223]